MPAVSLGADGSRVAGNVLMLQVQGTAFDIHSGYAIFIDRNPVAEGVAIPRAANVIEGSAAVLPIAGLAIGRHVIHGVPLDSGHHRLAGSLASQLGVTVDGPATTVYAPLTVRAGESIPLRLNTYGVTIADIAGDSSGRTAHYVLIVDGELPKAGALVSTPGAIRTADALVALGPMARGRHVIWIVLANGSNYALSPLVAARAEVTVAA